MDLVRQFFSSSVNPHDWLNNAAALTAMYVLSGVLTAVGIVKMFGRRQEGCVMVTVSGLATAVITFATQRRLDIMSRPEMWWDFSGSNDLASYAFVGLTVVIVLVAAVCRFGNPWASPLGRFLIGVSVLFTVQTTFVALRAWNEETISDSIICNLDAQGCDPSSADDALAAVPLWLLVLFLVIGASFVLSSLRGVVEWHKERKASPLVMVASPLSAVKRDQD